MVAQAAPATVEAAAPRLPPANQRRDGDLVSTLPPFGTNPPNRPVCGGSIELMERSIKNDPRDLWFLALPSKLTPKQIVMILRSALGGDIWQQWQLMSLMLDSWSMLRKCSHEIRQGGGRAPYAGHSPPPEGEETTHSAQQK